MTPRNRHRPSDLTGTMEKHPCARKASALYRADGGAQTPRGATVPRERAYLQKSSGGTKIYLHDNNILVANGDFELISAVMSVSQLCRPDQSNSRIARRFLRPAIAWEWPRRRAWSVLYRDETAHAVRLLDGLRRCDVCLRPVDSFCFGGLSRRPKQHRKIRRKKMLSVGFPRNEKKKKNGVHRRSVSGTGDTTVGNVECFVLETGPRFAPKGPSLLSTLIACRRLLGTNSARTDKSLIFPLHISPPFFSFRCPPVPGARAYETRPPGGVGGGVFVTCQVRPPSS